MHVFITGSGGHIGTAVVAELVGAGHEVVGLVRSDSTAAAVEGLGAGVIRGDVNDLDLVAGAARDADATIHLAYDNAGVAAGDLHAAADADLRVVAALGDALAGTGKALVGVGVGRTGDPDRDRALDANPRRRVALELAALADRDVRSVLVGVAPVTHSDRDRRGFVPTLIGIARRTGVSGYLGDGGQHWPAVHTLDLAVLYRLAIEKAPAGAQLLAGAEPGVLVRDIAASIGRHLGIPVESVPADRAAAHFAPFAFMGMDLTMPSDATRELVGWTPTHPTLLEDLDAGHYFDEAAGQSA